jgi:chromosome segregation ATPase
MTAEILACYEDENRFIAETYAAALPERGPGGSQAKVPEREAGTAAESDAERDAFRVLVRLSLRKMPNLKILSRQLKDANARVKDLRSRLQKARQTVRDLEGVRQKAIRAERRSQAAERELAGLCGSWSWRITAPLRWLAAMASHYIGKMGL